MRTFFIAFAMLPLFLNGDLCVKLFAEGGVGHQPSISDENAGDNHFTIKLKSDEAVILDRFFDVLIRKSEGGYVLYGKKPICIHGFSTVNKFYGSNSHHRDHVYIKEGATLWKRIAPSTDNNLIVHVYDRPDVEVSECIHVLVLNKKLFHEVVQKNLPLFQYVLGPSVTPQALLEKLTSPNETFHGVLKNDKVLIGILLGFGTQNALNGSRIENIQHDYFAAEQFPLKNRFFESPSSRWTRDLFLSAVDRVIAESHVMPSFSYTTLQEEQADLLKNCTISSPQLIQQRPHFVFSRLVSDPESEQLVKELEETQTKIIALLKNENKFEIICSLLLPHAHIAPRQGTLLFTPEERTLLAGVVGKNIWEIMEEGNAQYFESFLQGIQDADKGMENPYVKLDQDIRQLEAIKIAKSNVAQADHFFAALANDENFEAAKDREVYYRIIKDGNGNRLTIQPQTITVQCKAQTPNGETIKDTWSARAPIQVDLKNAIPGFVLGVNGMREGEIRELYIHPKSAYGLYTTMETGVYLVVKVELIAIGPSENSAESIALESFDFAPVFNRLDHFDEASKKTGYFLGHRIASHYKREPALALPLLIDLLKEKKRLGEAKIPLSPSEAQLINRLHWNIYQSIADDS